MENYPAVQICIPACDSFVSRHVKTSLLLCLAPFQTPTLLTFSSCKIQYSITHDSEKTDSESFSVSKNEDGDEKQRNNNTDYGNEKRCDVPEYFSFTSSLQTSRTYKSWNINKRFSNTGISVKLHKVHDSRCYALNLILCIFLQSYHSFCKGFNVSLGISQKLLRSTTYYH